MGKKREIKLPLVREEDVCQGSGSIFGFEAGEERQNRGQDDGTPEGEARRGLVFKLVVHHLGGN